MTVADRIARIEAEARSYRRSAATIRERLATWKPADPVEFKVEKKQPAIHFRAKVYGTTGKLCAGSVRAAFSVHLTDDRSTVTCSRCLAWLAKRDAKASKGIA